ncbi:unnamed protein product, partial [Brachionus calyciflorus]
MNQKLAFKLVQVLDTFDYDISISTERDYYVDNEEPNDENNLPKRTLETHLPGLLFKVCDMLKSRAMSVRKTTRECLFKMVDTVPDKKYYFNVFKELGSKSFIFEDDEFLQKRPEMVFDNVRFSPVESQDRVKPKLTKETLKIAEAAGSSTGLSMSEGAKRRRYTRNILLKCFFAYNSQKEEKDQKDFTFYYMLPSSGEKNLGPKIVGKYDSKGARRGRDVFMGTSEGYFLYNPGGTKYYIIGYERRIFLIIF